MGMSSVKKACIVTPFILTVIFSWQFLNDESDRSGQTTQVQNEEFQDKVKNVGYFDNKRRHSDIKNSPVFDEDNPLKAKAATTKVNFEEKVTDKFSFGLDTSVSRNDDLMESFRTNSYVSSSFIIVTEQGEDTTEDITTKAEQNNPVQIKETNPKISNTVDSAHWAEVKKATPVPEYKPTYIGEQRKYNENVVNAEETRWVLSFLNVTEVGVPNHVKDVYRPLDLSKNIGLLPSRRQGDYYENNYTKQSLGKKCSQNIHLTNFGPESSHQNQIFFLETSGRGYLNPRQACAVESAARTSKLKVKVILLSRILNVEDNITCHLYTALAHTVSFHTVDPAAVFADTPLEPLEAAGKFANSNFSATHYSDGLRLALVYKYGGFYSDLDVVVLHPLNTFINVIGQTSVNPKPHCHRHLANGEFHFVKGHAIPWQTMILFAKNFKGKSRIEVGPMLITAVIKAFFKIKWVTDIKPSVNLTVVPPEVFYPFKAFQCPRLWPAAPTCFSTWQEHFQLSVMVHMYGSMTNKFYVTRDPRHEAYSLLGPHYCPLAFYGTMDF